MKYKEMKINLFDLDYAKYCFAHCISLDCAMGKGIAKTFVEKEPQMRQYLLNTINENNLKMPSTILYINEMKIFNLITKNVYNGKPTYYTIYECIKQMKKICVDNDIKYLATYKLGCERDRLDWIEVKEMLINEFEDVDIEILICF